MADGATGPQAANGDFMGGNTDAGSQAQFEEALAILTIKAGGSFLLSPMISDMMKDLNKEET